MPRVSAWKGTGEERCRGGREPRKTHAEGGRWRERVREGMLTTERERQIDRKTDRRIGRYADIQTYR